MAVEGTDKRDDDAVSVEWDLDNGWKAYAEWAPNDSDYRDAWVVTVEDAGTLVSSWEGEAMQTEADGVLETLLCELGRSDIGFTRRG